MKFPDYFTNGCPPKEAKNIEYCAYRICNDKIIAHTDFLSYYELGLAQKSNNIKKYGISLNTERDTLIAMLGMPAQKNRDMKCVAKGITKEDLGVSMFTPSKDSSTHLTWWLKEGAEPEKYFECDYLKGE